SADFEAEPAVEVTGGPAGFGLATAGAELVWPAGGASAGAPAAADAGLPEPDADEVFGSTSDIICRKVPSSMGRSLLPSQVEPSGTRFCTCAADARTWSTLASATEIGTGMPRGSCERLVTRSQFTCSLCALSCFCRFALRDVLISLREAFFQLRASSSNTSYGCRYTWPSCQPNRYGWLTTRTCVPTRTLSYSCAMSSG